MTPFYNAARAEELLALANQWTGTPFHTRARLLGVGVDCVQLAAALYIGTGFLDTFAPERYQLDWGTHEGESRVIAYINSTGRFAPVEFKPTAEDYGVQTGDLLCFRFGRVAYHVAVAMPGNQIFQVLKRYTADFFPIEDTTWRENVSAVFRPLEL